MLELLLVRLANEIELHYPESDARNGENLALILVKEM